MNGGNHIIKLTRAGSTIDVSEGNFNFNNTVTAMAYSPIDPSHRYALTYNGIFYHSEDSGVNWTASTGFSGPDSHYFYGSKILPSKIDLGKVIIAGSGYSNPPIFVTFNHGNSFSNMSQGMPSTLVYDLASTENENFIFAATAVGAFAFLKINNYGKILLVLMELIRHIGQLSIFLNYVLQDLEHMEEVFGILF